jgi:hypothetical protein
MTLTYYYGRDDEYEFEYEADYDEAMEIVYEALKQDGYDITNEDEVTDELIDEYIDLCMDKIKEHFSDEAYDQWRDYEEYRRDPLGYYGFSIKDFI